jgi:hypothetical protein
MVKYVEILLIQVRITFGKFSTYSKSRKKQTRGRKSPPLKGLPSRKPPPPPPLKLEQALIDTKTLISAQIFVGFAFREHFLLGYLNINQIQIFSFFYVKGDRDREQGKKSFAKLRSEEKSGLSG